MPYSTQDINEADVRAVSAVLRSPFLTQGPAVEKFERVLAQYAGARYAVAFSSGTAALHAAYFAAGIGEGDEVITSALTFAATANAALYLGARPVFADIDLDSGTMSAADTEKRTTKKTKAIVPVDYGGRPADMRGFRALAKKHKIVLIQDGAQSLGASYRGKKVGRFADMTMFSFHPVKSITTGEGGVIVTDNPKYASRMRLFRHHGISKDASTFRDTKHGAWYQEMQTLGYNYRLSDIQAGLGISQMKRLDSNVERRRAIAGRYRGLLGDVPGIILPPKDSAGEKSAWHLYPIRLIGKLAAKRDAVFSGLRAKGIGVQVHYLPVYLHQYYRTLGYKPGICPHAEAYAASEISLPLYPGLSVRDQDYVAKTVREVIADIF
ncbi:MAG: UDP-4-amino-4,6-dideoxy-N-acetyl-beta-L-altrosamine transaminase [bacterium]|nr:UDP-4-amino-4,6-dideoxy-N-acetyl-beta-L-altrosamine transaminase [bacterium]